MVKKTRKLSKRLMIYIPLEINYRIKRNPVFIPPPSVKFRLVRRSKTDIAVTAN